MEQCQANLDLWEMQQVSPTLKGKLRMKYNSKFALGGAHHYYYG